MRHYYAADNYYGSENAIGFANTWYVVEFATKQERNKYVATSHKLSTRAIRAKDVRKYQSYQSN